VLDGLRIARQFAAVLWLRLPLVPSVNDTDAHFANLATLAREFRPERIEIVPYHPLGKGKRQRFGLPEPTPLPDASASPEQVRRWLCRLQRQGIAARLPGE